MHRDRILSQISGISLQLQLRITFRIWEFPQGCELEFGLQLLNQTEVTAARAFLLGVQH